jgi:hypothetical protein
MMVYQQKPKSQRNFLLYALLILSLILQIAILHKLSSPSRPEGLYINPAVYPQALIYIPPCEEPKTK